MLEKILLFCCFVINVAALPILDVELGAYKSSYTGETYILHYLDLPDSLFETTVLRCQLPPATSYEWRGYAKFGAPYTGSLMLSLNLNTRKHPWELQVSVN